MHFFLITDIQQNSRRESSTHGGVAGVGDDAKIVGPILVPLVEHAENVLVSLVYLLNDHHFVSVVEVVGISAVHVGDLGANHAVYGLGSLIIEWSINFKMSCEWQYRYLKL